MELKRITSFEVDHNTLKEGMYVSRIDGDVTTYDLRMKRPNGGDYLENKALHTIEHIIATFVRNSNYSENIIYFGPMGCRTGFYLLTRNLEAQKVIELVREAFEFLRDFEGEIPGYSAKECGNYLEHDLLGAKIESEKYLKAIKNYSVERLQY